MSTTGEEWRDKLAKAEAVYDNMYSHATSERTDIGDRHSEGGDNFNTIANANSNVASSLTIGLDEKISKLDTSLFLPQNRTDFIFKP